MSSITSSTKGISVIIPNWNGAAFLPACLDSVLQQIGIAKEVIVVDNASTDTSSDMLASYGNAIRVVQLETNVGFAGAVNAGIRVAENELLFVLNNDTVLENDCLINLVKAVRAYPDYGFYAAEIRQLENRTKLWAAGIIYSDRGYGNRSGRHLLAQVSRPMEIFGVCGAAAVFKRSVLETVGLFNEEFFLYHEDIELSFRHQLLGYRCLYVPGALVYHHGSGTTKRVFKLTVELRVRNAIATAFTCMPTIFMRRYGAKILWFYLRLSILVIQRGFFWSWLKAIAHLLLHSNKLVARRRYLQSISKGNIQHLESLLYRGPIEVNFLDEVIQL
jgi:GT2 family glycosyltransferase